MAVTSAISSLFRSIYEFIASIFGAAYNIVHGILASAFNLVEGVFNLLRNALASVMSMANTVTGFVAGNFIVLAVGAVLAYGFMRYTAQGQRVAQTKTAK